MTVRELLEILEKMPEDIKVTIVHNEWPVKSVVHIQSGGENIVRIN